MALLGKTKIQIPDPKTRKESMVKSMLEEAVKIDDSTLINFVLDKCWNKERIFTICGGQKLLHYASKENFEKSVQVLLHHSIDINGRDEDGNTCLHIAAIHGNEAVIDLLREGGCNPFIENKNGKLAIDLAVDDTISGILRHYNRKCSHVKMLKNLETWKNILAEEERKEEELKRKQQQRQTRRKTTSLQQNTTPVIIQHPPSQLKRSDSGIISDVDSEKSASNPRLSVTSVTSKAANIVSTQSSLTVPGYELLERSATITTTPKTTKTTKVSKSRSFNIKKDFTNQYNNVTAALRKLSSTNKNSDGKDRTGGSSTLRKNSPVPDIRIPGEIGNNDITEEIDRCTGLKCSPEYGPPVTKKNSRRRKINRMERMSLPLLPMFAPPESYI